MSKATIWGATGFLPDRVPHNHLFHKLAYVALESQKSTIKTFQEAKKFIETLPEYIKESYLGNTSCLELEILDQHIILDGGSGLKNLSYSLPSRIKGKHEFHLFLTHFHWDHISGLPLSPIMFNPNYHVNLYSTSDRAEEMIALKEYPLFVPIPFELSPAKKTFHVLKENDIIKLGNKVSVSHHNLYHYEYGASVAYRIDYEEKKKKKSFVYATDAEYSMDIPYDIMKSLIDFYKNADIMIFDGQYQFTEALVDKKTWGHSSNLFGLNLAIMAGIKKLILFHHDPSSTDKEVVRRKEKLMMMTEILGDKLNLTSIPEIELAVEGTCLEL